MDVRNYFVPFRIRNKFEACLCVWLPFLSSLMATYFLLRWSIVAVSPLLPVFVVVSILTLSPMVTLMPLLLTYMPSTTAVERLCIDCELWVLAVLSLISLINWITRSCCSIFNCCSLLSENLHFHQVTLDIT